jgi:hypothetical protein
MDTVAVGQVVLRVHCFPPSVFFHQCSTLVIYKLLIPERQTGKAGINPKSDALSDVVEHLIEENFHLHIQ